AQSHRRLGQVNEALTACQEGRRIYPEDTELLFSEGLIRRELGDPAGAERCLLALLQNRDGAHFASVDAGLHGYKARHNLAVLYQEQNRLNEAEVQWQTCLKEKPDFGAARLGLGEVYLAQDRWSDLKWAMDGLNGDPALALEATVLRGRAYLARKQFSAAR